MRQIKNSALPRNALPPGAAARFAAALPTKAPAGARASAIILILLALTPAIFGQTIHSSKAGTRYISEGRVNVAADYARLLHLAGDYAGYAAWVLPGLDGSDPESADDWVVFTDLRYLAPQTLQMDFDMNGPWPLNKDNNTASFSIRSVRRSPSLEITFTMLEPPFGVSDAMLKIKCDPLLGVSFRLELEVWPIADLFMNHDDFKDFLERKVRRVTANLDSALRAQR